MPPFGILSPLLVDLFSYYHTDHFFEYPSGPISAIRHVGSLEIVLKAVYTLYS